MIRIPGKANYLAAYGYGTEPASVAAPHQDSLIERRQRLAALTQAPAFQTLVDIVGRRAGQHWNAPLTTALAAALAASPFTEVNALPEDAQAVLSEFTLTFGTPPLGAPTTARSGADSAAAEGRP